MTVDELAAALRAARPHGDGIVYVEEPRSQPDVRQRPD